MAGISRVCANIYPAIRQSDIITEGIMLLYHGTNERALKSILREGILPRKLKGQRSGNWNHTVPSNPSAVYLTDTYAAYFAWIATGKSEHGKMVIIEVDVDKLDMDLMAPDEDALEQSLRDRDRVPGDMRARTMYYRRRARKLSQHWRDSLEGLGTVGYYGAVMPIAITRICVIDQEKQKQIVMGAADPSITLMNHRFCFQKYQALVRWLFGEEISVAEYIGFGQEVLDIYQKEMIEQIEQVLANRDGIDVVAGTEAIGRRTK